SAAKVKLTPPSTTFDAREPGTTSPTQTLTVENSGDVDLAISAASIAGGDGGDFSTGADDCTATKVAPGGRCTIEIRFAPKTSGAKNARLSIASNAPASPDGAPLH